MKMKKSIKIRFFALLLSFSAIFSATSQVAIGTLEQPLKGTLLDLKEWNVSNGAANSDKGLMLPRVNLTNISSLEPMANLSDANLKLNYTGLVVYNVSTTAPFQKGLYSWNGTQWNLLSPISAANGLNVSNVTVKLGGDLTQPTTINLDNNDLIFDSSSGGKVGIGTSQPAATLDIAGTGRITNTPLSQNTMNEYLVVDNSGNIRSRANAVYRIGKLASSGITNWLNSTPSDILDFYFIDRIHTITLPTPSSAFEGKLIRFYIYGGAGVNVVFNTINRPSNWTCSVSGFTYSGTAGHTTGILTVSDSQTSSVRFRFIDIICDGENWWVNNE